jgi:hypothetical protein
MGPILAAVVVSEIDGIELPRLCLWHAGLCPSTHSSGGKTFKATAATLQQSPLAFVEAAWLHGCSAYFGDFYKRKRALGKPSLAILATARLMAESPGNSDTAPGLHERG